MQRENLGFQLPIEEVHYWTLFYGQSSTHIGNCSISATRQNTFHSAIDFLEEVGGLAGAGGRKKKEKTNVFEISF